MSNKIWMMSFILGAECFFSWAIAGSRPSNINLGACERLEKGMAVFDKKEHDAVPYYEIPAGQVPNLFDRLSALTNASYDHTVSEYLKLPQEKQLENFLFIHELIFNSQKDACIGPIQLLFRSLSHSSKTFTKNTKALVLEKSKTYFVNGLAHDVSPLAVGHIKSDLRELVESGVYQFRMLGKESFEVFSKERAQKVNSLITAPAIPGTENQDPTTWKPALKLKGIEEWKQHFRAAEDYAKELRKFVQDLATSN